MRIKKIEKKLATKIFALLFVPINQILFSNRKETKKFIKIISFIIIIVVIKISFNICFIFFIFIYFFSNKKKIDF